MSKKVDVPDKVISNAYSNFVSMYYPGETSKGHYFWNFIGADINTLMDREGLNWSLPPKAAELARMLAGPHYKTIAKAMEINGARWDIRGD